MIEEKLLQPIVVRNEIAVQYEWLESQLDGYWIHPEYLHHESITRLVAIIPFGRIDRFAVSHRIGDLATTYHWRVLILGLSPAAEYWYREHLKLDCIASAVSNRETHSMVVCSSFQHWQKAVKDVVKTTDAFACLAHHDIKTSPWRKYPISEWLSHTFNVPVFIMEHLEIKPY